MSKSVTYQTGWVMCTPCSSLVFTDGQPTGGVCIMGEYGHIYMPLFKYRVAFEGEGIKGQVDWRHCNKCSALFYAGNPTKGVCPVDHGVHDDSESGAYEVIHSTIKFPLSKNNWRWCRKCEQLFSRQLITLRSAREAACMIPRAAAITTSRLSEARVKMPVGN